MFKLTLEAGDGKVKCFWETPQGAKKFRLRRAQPPSSTGTVIATTAGTTYDDTAVTNGLSYGYIVIALDRRGKKIDESSYETATPKKPSLFDLPALVGHGKAVTGGGDAIPQKVSTIAEFIEAIQDSGKRVIYGTHEWLYGAGQQINPGSGDLTIVGVSLGKLGINYRAVSNVRLHDYRSLPNLMETPNTDGFTVNGQSSDGPVQGFAMSNGWSAGGPDMGGGAILGEVFDFTAQHWVFGPGLRQSVGSDERDHNRILNFTTFGDHADGPWGKRQTTFECLVWGGEERNPDLKYVEGNDFVRNLIYNFRENPGGNPRGCNYLFNRVRTGPESDLTKARVYKTSVKPDETVFAGSVYAFGNVPDGFTNAEPTIDTAAKRNTIFGVLSVPMPTAAPSVEDILSVVGPTSGRNSQEQKLLDFVRNRTSEGYYTGPGTGSPNLTWPPNP